MSKAMSLKARIRNLAKEKQVPAQVILQNYMFERLLVRLAASEYKDKFVLNGGMLVAAIVGLEKRATMDLDTTLKSLPLTPEAIVDTVTRICAVPMDDDVTFTIGTIAPIREDDIYGGFRLSLTARFETILTPLTIDISTGDVITPHAVQRRFLSVFDEKETYELWSYNVETILAEKAETILRRGVFNPRPRDFYDVFILTRTQHCDKALFRKALQETSTHRGTTEQIADVSGILKELSESPELLVLWEKYRKQFPYAQSVSFSDVMNAVSSLLTGTDTN